MPENLQKNILHTIAYYNELGYPMTLFELWKYLNRCEFSNELESKNNKISINEILEALEMGEVKKYIESYNGFYFLAKRGNEVASFQSERQKDCSSGQYLLKGKKELVEKRIANTKEAILKIRKLRRFIKIISFIPFVRMVALTGRLAMKNIENQSDWDLLIVIKSGRIWIGRTLVTLLVHLMRKRRYGNKIKDRICLNYFLADNSLEITHKDIFSANEYYFAIPLFGKKIYRKFMKKNSWILDFKFNFHNPEVDNLNLLEDNRVKIFLQGTLELVFGSDWLERKLRNWERRKIIQNPKTALEGSFIEASDQALIFFPQPKGPRIFENFQRSLEKLK